MLKKPLIKQEKARKKSLPNLEIFNEKLLDQKSHLKDNVADKHSYDGSQKIEIENVFISKNEIEYLVDERGCIEKI